MRHVIKANEVCEAWVSMAGQTYAHTQTRNMSFADFDRLLSYRTAIASRLEVNGKFDNIFVTRHNYSVTTNKQMRELYFELRGKDYIGVPYKVPTRASDIPGIWREMIAEVQFFWDKASRARQRRPSLLAEGNGILKDANKLVEMFDLSVGDGIHIDKLEDMNETMRAFEAQIKLRAA